MSDIKVGQFYTPDTSYDVFEVFAIDDEKVSIQQVSKSVMFESIDQFMHEAFRVYGQDVIKQLDQIRSILDQMPEMVNEQIPTNWKVHGGMILTMSIQDFIDNEFELIEAEDAIEAIEILEAAKEEDQMNRMMDMGQFGFGGPMFEEQYH